MPSQETHLKVTNASKTDIFTTAVSGIDPFDWENKHGPAGNFQGVSIPAGKSEERREEVNRFASNCPFTMKLMFADKTVDVYTINQKFAIGEAQPDFSHTGPHLVTYDQSGKYLIITVRDKAKKNSNL
ncbi:hypothetical protein TcasGA2_TC015789 [Tribolium castaneum]|uniref:Uncharacterized protein n=1 Tax=Tribolium castaneum TaxID=7070 RepID=D2A3Z6_TRICA|nr:PREDICTED: uncharacterized protein LOC103313450 isoform X1 [Tribolium castaneum]EFA05586.1 hypothetical protein TcasGA2_TC015789 [Tribolium castaneum]|eukprot:XP_008194967.1 PREDICTED: uncharacterized protein LOC103313450 isoform X1 [Tribolium castaneum]